MSKLRVAERVFHGGHRVAEADIERRFPRSLRNLLQVFSQRADRTRCFMNTGQTPALVFEESNGTRNIVHAQFHELLLTQAGLK